MLFRLGMKYYTSEILKLGLFWGFYLARVRETAREVSLLEATRLEGLWGVEKMRKSE